MTAIVGLAHDGRTESIRRVALVAPDLAQCRRWKLARPDLRITHLTSPMSSPLCGLRIERVYVAPGDYGGPNRWCSLDRLLSVLRIELCKTGNAGELHYLAEAEAESGRLHASR